MNTALARPLHTSSPEDLVPAVALEQLLAQREAALQALQTIAQGVSAYRQIGEAIWSGTNHGDGPWTGAPYTYREPIEQRPSGRGVYLDHHDWLAAATASLDASLWDHLLQLSGLRTFLDAKARKEWLEQIEARKTPSLTPENIRATFLQLHAERATFFERGVIEVYKRLSWSYASNTPHRFGRRIIIRHVRDGFGHPGASGDAVDDLIRAFHILDGIPEPDHRQAFSRRLWREKGTIENGYVSLRTFKNGNGHLTFLRPELVDGLNRILARHFPHALPPADAT